MRDESHGPEVVLHAERAVVQGVAVPVERVRWGKRIVTEERTVTVQVRREEFFLEVTDLTGGTVTTGVPPATGGEVVLLEEQVEVVTRGVPRERVRVVVERQERAERVDVELRHEEVEVQGA
jgi:uncharacterized protein (TIGR02271 family)